VESVNNNADDDDDAADVETGCWKQDIFSRIIDCSYAPVTAQTLWQFINLNVTVATVAVSQGTYIQYFPHRCQKVKFQTQTVFHSWLWLIKTNYDLSSLNWEF